jgi:Bacterial lipocalin
VPGAAGSALRAPERVLPARRRDRHAGTGAFMHATGLTMRSGCGLAAAVFTAALLVGGCAGSATKPVADAYCLNATGAALAPASVRPVHCTNLPAGAARAAPLPAPARVTDDAPLKLAPEVDLPRYMGRWYVIANIPYLLERGKVGAYVEYRNPGGRIQDLYFAHDRDFSTPVIETRGHGYVVKGTHNARWRVTFLWPLYVSYPILYVSPHYQVALVGYPDRSLGWVFARKPVMGNAELRRLLARFAAQGYDVSKFRRVPQTQAQLDGG